MKIRIFQSHDGDCALLTSADGKMVLADGGRSVSYSLHVAPFLAGLETKNKQLELLYISHIDEDHVDGVLQLLDDLVEWTVADFHVNDPDYKIKTKNGRPMKPKKIWHNSFHETVKKNAGDITKALAATATVLSGSDLNADLKIADVHRDLATSMTQAAQISRRIGDKQLKIPLNPEFKGELMMLKNKGKPHPPIKIGTMNWFLIGPFQRDLENLRTEWNKWLVEVNKKGKTAIDGVQEQAADDERRLLGNSASEVPRLINRSRIEARALGEQLRNLGLATTPGRDEVTLPNLASLMFLVEETNKKGKTKTVLMTGDGHWRDILQGLKAQGKLDANGNIHVDVLKMPHHGATANILNLEWKGKKFKVIGAEFFEKVTADKYVFCGMSHHHKNPEIAVLDALLDSRLNPKQGSHPKVNDKFEILFSTDSSNPRPRSKADNEYAEELEKHLAAHADAKFTVQFNTLPSFEFTV